MNANTSMWMWRFDCIDTGWYSGKDGYDLLIENKQVMTIEWEKKQTAAEMESKSCKRESKTQTTDNSTDLSGGE